MKRTRNLRHARLTPRVGTLIELAEAYARSCSRLEDEYWERRLDEAIDGLIEEQNEEGLNAALDQLHEGNARAYEILADTIEAHCERRHIDGHDVQLIAIPVLAWSRFSIPAGAVPAATLDTARVHLQAHVFASGAKLALCDFLFSPDHLPQGFCPTVELTESLGRAALLNQNLTMDTGVMPETMKFLADTRYLLAAVAVPPGAALFRWQEKSVARADVERQWLAQGGNALQALLPACATEFVLPLAYFAACRDTDHRSRPFSLHASVEFLKTTLDVPASRLRAVVAPFYETQLEEFRIGFTLTGSRDVVYGLVWPLLEAEDENSELPTQIETLLRERGVEHINLLESRFPLEYCDDCGTPLYPNPDGETVHAELPEDEAEAVPRHLH